jgi:DNA-binding transcriptional LysR family regulator
MPSLKQIEAFYWAATLGSFVAAAERLNTTQSNISKRIQELELTLGVKVFDRTRRAIRLTMKGVELMRATEHFLRAYTGITAISTTPLGSTGPFRFGVTEAVGLTWLPLFCKALMKAFPGLIPTAYVNSSHQLNLLLEENKIDLAIGTRHNFDLGFEISALTSLDRIWVASPTLVPNDHVIGAEEFARLPFLGHGELMSVERIINRYLRDHGHSLKTAAVSRNLTSLARMAAAGLGVTYLHRGVFDADMRAGRLHEIQTEIELPRLDYVAVHRDDPISPLTESIAGIAKAVCDFSWSQDSTVHSDLTVSG